MEQYIDKAALVAEIEKAISELRRNYNPNPLGNRQDCIAAVEIEALNLIIYSLGALKVKEVDLEKEIERFVKSDEFQKAAGTIKVIYLLAKHFFELGVRTTHSITANDIGIEAHIIGLLNEWRFLSSTEAKYRREAYAELLEWIHINQTQKEKQ